MYMICEIVLDIFNYSGNFLFTFKFTIGVYPVILYLTKLSIYMEVTKQNLNRIFKSYI